MVRTTERTAFPPLTPPAVSSAASRTPTRTLEIAVGDAVLYAELAMPADAVAIVAVLHGAAGERLDPSHQSLIERLHEATLATLRVDLFTAEEMRGDHANGAPFFDIRFLVDRVVAITSALHAHPATQGMPLGLVGDRAIATAVLYVAAEYPERVDAVVTRSARPDLAGPFFPRLTTPTLLIVGARDHETRRINEEAFLHLKGPRSLEIIPEATHQFAEPRAREQAATLTSAWLMRHLCTPVAATSRQPVL